MHVTYARIFLAFYILISSTPAQKNHVSVHRMWAGGSLAHMPLPVLSEMIMGHGDFIYTFTEATSRGMHLWWAVFARKILDLAVVIFRDLRIKNFRSHRISDRRLRFEFESNLESNRRIVVYSFKVNVKYLLIAI